MSNDFIKMINDIDLLYGFIYECADLVNNLCNYDNYDYLTIPICGEFVIPRINITKKEHIKEYYTHSAIKLCSEFVIPIINITEKEHIKEYNEHIKDIIDNLKSTKDIYSICSYLMNIC